MSRVDIKSEPQSDGDVFEVEDTGISPPSFVVNVSVYVPSDSETDSSESDWYDDEHEFSEEEFKDPPFFIDPTKRGVVDDENCFIPDDESDEGTVIQNIVDKLHAQGFSHPELGQQEVLVTECLSAGFGLNRPRSLSSGKNNLLFRELLSLVKGAMCIRKFGFFWDYVWQKREIVRGHERIRSAEYKEVHSFYKQMKEWDWLAARDFRRENEGQSRSSMVPYREIREKVKVHRNTEDLVRRVSGLRPGSDVYLSFVDGDTLSFCMPGGCGIYAAYTMLYLTASAPPEAMSTGYTFFHEKMPMLKLASVLDMEVRTATAKHIPAGVYYPEPNFVVRVRVREGKFNLEETFLGGRRNYTSPQEAPILLKQVAQRKSMKEGRSSFLFGGGRGTIGSPAPDRATRRSKRSKPFIFSAEPSDSGRFIGWTRKDIVNITRSMCQSHVAPRDWAVNLLNAFDLNHKVAFAPDLSITDGSTIRNCTISLLSRLYKVYDPISIVSDDSHFPADLRGESYEDRLRYVLTYYDQCLVIGSLPKVERKPKTRSLPLEQPRRRHVKNTKAQKDRARRICDELDSVPAILEMLVLLINDCRVAKINSAARESGRAICSVLTGGLDLEPAAEPRVLRRS